MQLLTKSREVANAGWMIGGKILQMSLNLVVGVLTARYMGPANYGLLNYAATYVAFFSSLCSLGINGVIIKDFVDHPDEQGLSIGTTLILRAISSLCSLVIIYAAVSLIDYGETLTIAVTLLSSMSLVFHIFDTLNCWFNYRYQSKTVAIASLCAYAVMAAYKIILLIIGKDVRWFAFAMSIDYIASAVVLLMVYRKEKGPKFRFSWSKGRELLKKSYPYILSGMMTAVYAQTDKVMLKQMMSNADAGYYSAATAISSMWTFVLAAIIDAIFPTIYRANKQDQELFCRKNRQLYAIVSYLSVFVSILFLFLSEFVVWVLYGSEFLPASNPLRIIVWGTMFSYLGVARHAWIVCRNAQKHLMLISVFAASLNIVLNAIMIPRLGASGAAAASVAAQFLVCFVVPACIKELRPNVKLMAEAIVLKGVFGKKKRLE